MTEGPDELAFVEVLIKKGIFIFSKDELLMEEVFHKRQIDGEPVGYIQTLQFGDTVDIFRIGDKLSDSLKIPRSILPEKVRDKFKICTLPEFEILFILNEGLYEDYIKMKTEEKPSVFYGRFDSKYKKQSAYVEKYFDDMNAQDIIKLVDLYVQKRGKTHKKDQLTLQSILKRTKKELL